jgi:hypothetical protein
MDNSPKINTKIFLEVLAFSIRPMAKYYLRRRTPDGIYNAKLDA